MSSKRWQLALARKGSLKWIAALKEKDEDLENIQAILSQYEKPIDFMYKVFHKIHSFVK